MARWILWSEARGRNESASLIATGSYRVHCEIVGDECASMRRTGDVDFPGTDFTRGNTHSDSARKGVELTSQSMAVMGRCDLSKRSCEELAGREGS